MGKDGRWARQGEGGAGVAGAEAGGDKHSRSPRILSTTLKNVDLSGGTRGGHLGVGRDDIIGFVF